MEFQKPFQKAFGVFFTFFVFLLVLFKIVKKSKSKNSPTNLPPGPSKLPLIGNLHYLFGSTLPHHTLRNLATKFGPLMHLKLGEVSNIIVSSPEMAKEVMKTNDIIFSNTPQTLVSKIAYNATDIVFSSYGGYWKQLRKICTAELLNAKRVQSFRFIREEEIAALIAAIASSEGSVVNLSEMILSLTYGIMARATIGEKSYQQKWISIIEEALSHAGGLCVADLYPSIRILLQKFSLVMTKSKKVFKMIDSILDEIIDDHKNRKSRHCGTYNEDLVDVLLNFQQQKDLEYPLTDDNIKAVILDVLCAGTETSTAVVEWAMAEMVKNPEVMEQAQAEVRRVFDSKGCADDETNIHQLKYLKCVIKETMRLHPPAPLLLPRESNEKCEINGFEIPAKSRVIINAWAIGRDPNHWNEPERFKPERFLDSQVDFNGTDFEFIPFSAGNRMCPCITFAITDIEMALAKLLYHFNWRLPNGIKHEELDMTESYGLIARRKNGLCLIPVSYHPSTYFPKLCLIPVSYHPSTYFPKFSFFC